MRSHRKGSLYEWGNDYREGFARLQNKQGTAEINAAALNVGSVTKVLGQDAGALPSSAYIRLRVQLSGTSAQAHVLIYATGRGQ